MHRAIYCFKRSIGSRYRAAVDNEIPAINGIRTILCFRSNVYGAAVDCDRTVITAGGHSRHCKGGSVNRTDLKIMITDTKVVCNLIVSFENNIERSISAIHKKGICRQVVKGHGARFIRHDTCFAVTGKNIPVFVIVLLTASERHKGVA